MHGATFRLMVVAGSNRRTSATRTALDWVADRACEAGASVDRLDLRTEPLELFDPDRYKECLGYSALRERVLRADAFLLGSPDYHGSISGCLKNFLDYFWREFAGKLFASIVASHDKGLTV